MTNREGIVGYWEGNSSAPDAHLDAAQKRGAGDILYAQADVRARILEYALFSQFKVEHPTAEEAISDRARILAGGTQISEIKKPTRDQFKTQLSFLRSYADLRPDRLEEIDIQLDDITSFFGTIGYLDPQRRARTLDILTAVENLAVYVEMQVKHMLHSPRPIDYAPEVQPLIQTPDHSSFPSGHACESFAVAATLHYLMDSGRGQGLKAAVGARSQLFRVAERMSANRTVAGVHFPCDSAAGALLGCQIAHAVATLATGGTVQQATQAFAVVDVAADVADNAPPPNFRQDQDFDLDWLEKALSNAGFPAATAEQTSVLGTAWRLAVEEWNAP